MGINKNNDNHYMYINKNNYNNNLYVNQNNDNHNLDINKNNDKHNLDIKDNLHINKKKDNLYIKEDTIPYTNIKQTKTNSRLLNNTCVEHLKFQ